MVPLPVKEKEIVNVSIEKVAAMLWSEVTLLKVYDKDGGVCNAPSAEILNTPDNQVRQEVACVIVSNHGAS
jgi:hypothetical protein